MANKQRPSWFAKMASQLSSVQLNVFKSGQTIQESKVYLDVCRNMKNILTDINHGNIERENLVFFINPMIYTAMYDVAVDKNKRWLCYYNSTKFIIESGKINTLSLYNMNDVNDLLMASQDAMRRSMGWNMVVDMVLAISRIAIMTQEELIAYNSQFVVLDYEPIINVLMHVMNSYRNVFNVNELFD